MVNILSHKPVERQCTSPYLKEECNRRGDHRGTRPRQYSKYNASIGDPMGESVYIHNTVSNSVVVFCLKAIVHDILVRKFYVSRSSLRLP